MTLEEMKKEMVNNGYHVHKKMDEKLLERRNQIYFKIFDYIQTKEVRYYQQFGKWPEIYCAEIYAQNKVRAEMRKKYNTIDYSIIPDEHWPEMKKELINVGKSYIDCRFNKLKP